MVLDMYITWVVVAVADCCWYNSIFFLFIVALVGNTLFQELSHSRVR